MKKILVDTSVWIDALNGKQNWQTKLLSRLIDNDVAIVLCPIIIQEILQGIRSDSDFKHVKESLDGFEVLEIEPIQAAYGAAELYRNIRKQGITVRKSNDCLIAYYSIYCNTLLLHNDEDFNKIAGFTTLQTLKNDSI